MYIVIWEFQASSGREAEFEKTYGPSGVWAGLFSRADGYLGTELLKDQSRPRRYLTIDRWITGASYETFRMQWEDKYTEIDRRCEALTEMEAFRGSYRPIPPAS